MIADRVGTNEVVITADLSASVIVTTRISRHKFMVPVIPQLPKLPRLVGQAMSACALLLGLTHSVTAQLHVVTADHRPQMGLNSLNDQPTRLPTLEAQPVVYQTEACGSCNQAGSIGAFGNGAGSGCALRGTNLFWCSPFPDLVQDPCGTNPCESCNYNSPPLFYASLEVVPLYRDQKDDPLFQTLGPGGPAVLETGDFETDFDAGMRVVLGATLTDRYRVEAAYLGSYEWSDRVAIRNQQPNSLGSPGNLFSPFSNFGKPTGISGVDYNNFAQIEMTSNFNSAEFNVRRRCCSRPRLWPYQRNHACVANSFLVGLRYLSLDEGFNYATQSAVPAGGSINRAFVDTTNDMFGVQIGMLSQFTTYWENGWVDFELKGGIYHNEAEMRSVYERANGAGVVSNSFVGTDAHDRTSFLGEVSLNYNHQITSNLSMRLGYNAFWLSGVALASQNMNSNLGILAAGPAQIDHAGDVVYHGPSVGFTFAY